MKQLLEQIYGNRIEKYSEKKVSLPLYLKDGRAFYDVSVFGHPLVIVYLMRLDRFQIKSLRKQLETYRNAFEMPVVYGFDRISSFQRRSLVENGIPFVARNGQVFLPFLGAYFEKCPKEEELVKEQFMPATQLLFLLFLYEFDSYTKSGAANRLHINPMSITRASKQLVEKGLIKEEKRGTEINMEICEKDRKAFYKKGEKYLINPIQSVIYLDNARRDSKTPASGEYALSLVTEIGYPEYVEYAYYKDNPVVKEWVGVNPDLMESDKLVRIQKWKYDPTIFSGKYDSKIKDNVVDPVSLICTFKDETDERIQKCLETVKGEIPQWLKIWN